MDVIKITSILTIVTLFLFGGFAFSQYFKGEPVFEDIYEDIECSVEEVYKNKEEGNQIYADIKCGKTILIPEE